LPFVVIVVPALLWPSMATSTVADLTDGFERSTPGFRWPEGSTSSLGKDHPRLRIRQRHESDARIDLMRVGRREENPLEAHWPERIHDGR
jgi:hypothetical protein